jgi:ABC-type molybdate transport system substrate-binding protein
VTDTSSAHGKVKTVSIPAKGQPTVKYEIAVVRSTKHLAAARAFVREVLGRKGREKLRLFGFGLP